MPSIEYVYIPGKDRLAIKAATASGVAHYFISTDKYYQRFVLNNGKYEWANLDWKDKVPKTLVEKLIRHGFIINRNHPKFNGDDSIFIVNVDAIKDKVDSDGVFDFDAYWKNLKAIKSNKR